MSTLDKFRFLFFLYYYPPLRGTAPKRNHLISSEIAKHASFSQVFTSAHEKEVLENKDGSVSTIPAFDYRFFLRKKTKDGALPEEKKKNKVMQAMIRLINTFPVNILIGEGGMFYFLSLLRKGQRSIRENNITHIYSSYRPFTDHYAAYILKKRNPHIYWIADFRDLLIDPHTEHILLPKPQKVLFKKIFKYADLLTTVSNGLAKHLKEYNSNVITLRNGIRYLPEEFIPVHCKYFKIAYTGSMFLDKRNAEPLFIALTDLINQNMIKLEDIRIIYAGKDSQYWENMSNEYGFSSIFMDKGIVSEEEASAIQQNACINLLLTISSDELQGVLTGKMIEYFETGNPVLGIVVNKNDPELSHILSELEIGRSFSDQKEDLPEIKDFIISEYMYWKKNGTNRKAVNMKVLKHKYSIEATMRPLFDKIAR